MAEMGGPDWSGTVETAFGRVRVYRFDGGPGEPLLLPGRNASAPMWAANLPPLRRGRTVYALDGLGEPGCSAQSAPIASAADQAAWLDQTLEGLGLDAVHLLGVSIGGWLGVQMLLHRPQRVLSLMALDPARTFGELTPAVVLVSLGAVLPMPDRWRGRLVGLISGGIDHSQELAVGRLVAAGMKHFDVRLPPPVMPTGAELAAISTPVLVVIAGRSVIHRPGRAAARARAHLGEEAVELWPDASHAISGEYPREIADRLDRFVAGAGRPGA
ncbi:alpha/beta fold hydrolase, partial [Nocardiopsis protaetiae]